MLIHTDLNLQECPLRCLHPSQEGSELCWTKQSPAHLVGVVVVLVSPMGVFSGGPWQKESTVSSSAHSHSCNILMHHSVPVWDCTEHFVQDCRQDIDSFSPTSVLSQKDWRDPYFAGEIEDGALVAVIHTTSIYKCETDFTSTISLKIAGICVLALPTTSH